MNGYENKKELVKLRALFQCPPFVPLFFTIGNSQSSREIPISVGKIPIF